MCDADAHFRVIPPSMFFPIVGQSHPNSARCFYPCMLFVARTGSPAGDFARNLHDQTDGT